MNTWIVSLVLMLTVGCSSAPSDMVTMDPLTPEEVGALTHATTSLFLMERNVSPDQAKKIVLYIQGMQAVLATSSASDVASLRTELVEHVPAEWQPLAEVSWVLLLNRIHLDVLMQTGQSDQVRAYLAATLNGALQAANSRAVR